MVSKLCIFGVDKSNNISRNDIVAAQGLEPRTPGL